ncbi:cell envelope-related transcriptional attenuator, partial [Thermobifida fusca TM51]
MADRPHPYDRAPGGSSGSHDRTGVFRRNPDGGLPDRIDSLYRPEPAARSASDAAATRRLSRTSGTPPRRPTPRSRGRDSGGWERRERERRAR